MAPHTVNSNAETNITRRFFAGLIDYTLILGLTYAYIKTFGQPNEGGYQVTGLSAFVPVLFWLSLTVFIELGMGATIGNGIAGLKPVPLYGRSNSITFGQSLKRHLADPIDMFLFGLIAIVTIKSTPNRQRLGDIWANTTVVRD
ncbi:MAG: RDD family protein [Sphingobacteriales bacterium]|nr:MAG: RDD family protein [Sphingobacteriales bacterium]